MDVNLKLQVARFVNVQICTVQWFSNGYVGGRVSRVCKDILNILCRV